MENNREIGWYIYLSIHDRKTTVKEHGLAKTFPQLSIVKWILTLTAAMERNWAVLLLT